MIEIMHMASKIRVEEVAIRSAPSPTASVLDTIHPGTLIRVTEVREIHDFGGESTRNRPKT